MLIAAAVLIVFPFQNAGSTTDGWDKAIFLAPLIIGLVAFLGVFAVSYPSGHLIAVPAACGSEKQISGRTTSMSLEHS